MDLDILKGVDLEDLEELEMALEGVNTEITFLESRTYTVKENALFLNSVQAYDKMLIKRQTLEFVIDIRKNENKTIKGGK